jgi:hypothetical protein
VPLAEENELDLEALRARLRRSCADPLLRFGRAGWYLCSPEWVARIAIVAAFVALTIYTWAHWGDVDIDGGREMYVPAALARGKVLYRDLWYAYGPLAPYSLAALFRWFGANLYVLYCFGLATTLGFALLLFEISRRFVPNAFALVVAFCALLQSFQADNFNRILPYSYASALASLIGLACLYFLLRSTLAASGVSLLVAGCCAGLALMCKQEFGYACYATVVFAAVALTGVASPARTLLSNTLLCVPGLGAGLAAYLWSGLTREIPILLLERVFRSQTSYLVQSWGPKWNADRGFRFHPVEILRALAMLGLSLLVWYVLARFLGWLWRHLWLLWCVIILALAAVVALTLKLPFIFALYSYRYFTEFAVFPTGMFWLACGVFVWSTVTFLRQRQTGSLAVAVTSVYAITTGIRIMAQVEPRNYAIFYNSALFLLFVFVVARFIDRAAASRPPGLAARVRLSLACLQVAWLALLLLPYPKSYPARLATDRGVIYTRPAEAALFPSVVSFIEQRKAQGQSAMVLPEATSLYFFTGTDAPAKWYALNPGVLSPDDEDEFAAEIEHRKVDFILLTNRRTEEYGANYFGLDYNQRLYRWIEANYEPVGQFGEFVREKDRPFAILIYRRREQ